MMKTSTIVYITAGLFIAIGLAVAFMAILASFSPKNLDSAAQNSTSPVFVGLGFLLIFGGLGLGLILYTARAKKGSEWLVDDGVKVAAQIIEIKHLEKNYWMVVSTWTDPKTGQAYIFESELINQRLANTFKPGQLLPVYVDPKAPTNYWFRVDD